MAACQGGGDPGVVQLGIAQHRGGDASGVLPMAAGQAAGIELGSAEIALAQVCPLQIGPAQIGTPQGRSLEAGETQVGPFQAGPIQPGLAQVGALESGAAQIRIPQVGMDQVGVLQLAAGAVALMQQPDQIAVVARQPRPWHKQGQGRRAGGQQPPDLAPACPGPVTGEPEDTCHGRPFSGPPVVPLPVTECRCAGNGAGPVPVAVPRAVRSGWGCW